MKKIVYWIIWCLALVTINLGAFPIAMFSLFDTAEGTSIFSLDYAIAFAIIVFANIITVQLFISLRKHDQISFIIGLMIAIIEVLSLVLFFNGVESSICIALAAGSIIGATILLVKTIIR
ncbi:MAG: hypothetical protein ACI4XL_10880 [Bacillus sp. (in: firmicutes)]